MLDTCPDDLQKCLHIQFDDEQRTAIVVLDGEKMNATLKDLPCIVESYKTLDRKYFYKVGDYANVFCTLTSR
jgi:transcription initiation factor TFIID subunit 7